MHLKHYGIFGACCKMGQGAILGTPPWATLASGQQQQLPAPPLIPPSFSCQVSALHSPYLPLPAFPPHF
jgi:hypothetical protein